MNGITGFDNNSDWNIIRKTEPKEVENKNPYYSKVLASGVFDKSSGSKQIDLQINLQIDHFSSEGIVSKEGPVLTIKVGEEDDSSTGLFPCFLGEIKPLPGQTKLVITVEDYSGSPWNTKIGFSLTDNYARGGSSIWHWIPDDQDPIPVDLNGKAYSMWDGFISGSEPEFSGIDRDSVLVYDISEYAASGKTIYLGAKVKAYNGSKMQFRFELK